MYFVKHQDIYQIVLNKYYILLNLQINFKGSVNVRNICILIRQIVRGYKSCIDALIDINDRYQLDSVNKI